MLSIIIVNFNVKFFLEQCLFSLEKALRQYPREAEILVVDNDSRDGSLEYLERRFSERRLSEGQFPMPKFPEMRFIRNPLNAGFARANNLALSLARGEYILFLNPDTIVAEDSLEIMIAFLADHTGAGAAGPRMINGGGHFLKESRRGFPGPWVSFCKLSGLTALFPRSGFFAGYYLGGSDENKNGPAPILSGACMLVKKQVLDRVGGFDERFFMYAEDIDLSARIGQAGYTNYYIADTTIIHFKGESTPRDARYVKHFFRAMSQFNHKYYNKGLAAAGSFFMDFAIGLAALLSLIRQFFSKNRPRPGNSPDSGTWIAGDPREAARLSAILKEKKAGGSRVFADDPSAAKEILFCEGEAFSFKKIMEEMRNQPGVRYLLHGSGTDCIVGSPSGGGKGDLLTG